MFVARISASHELSAVSSRRSALHMMRPPDWKRISPLMLQNLAYSLIYDVIQCKDLTVIATTMPPGRYSTRHIDRWSVSVASCEATR